MPNTTVSLPLSPLDQNKEGTSIGTGVNLLLFIIYGMLVVLLVGIFVQRLLQRIVPKYSKGYTDVGKYAPKHLKEDIDKRLMKTLHVVHEPKLLANNDERLTWLTEDNSDEKEMPYNYLYRMKAVDDIKRLEDALCQTDESLKRHPLKDLKQHLKDVKSHSSGVMKTCRSNQMKSLTDGYEHARYKSEPFGKKEYEKFTEVLNDIISGIESKSKKKRAKKSHSQRNTNNSRSEGAALTKNLEKDDCTFSENEPLIKENSSKKSL